MDTGYKGMPKQKGAAGSRLTVCSKSPNYPAEEREVIKRKIESRLYEIFYPYFRKQDCIGLNSGLKSRFVEAIRFFWGDYHENRGDLYTAVGRPCRQYIGGKPGGILRKGTDGN